MKPKKHTGTKVKRSRSDLIFDLCSDLLLGCLSLVVLYPLYFVLIASISTPEASRLFPSNMGVTRYRT